MYQWQNAFSIARFVSEVTLGCSPMTINNSYSPIFESTLFQDPTREGTFSKSSASGPHVGLAGLR